jgi:hypothetical protein
MLRVRTQPGRPAPHLRRAERDIIDGVVIGRRRRRSPAGRCSMRGVGSQSCAVGTVPLENFFTDAYRPRGMGAPGTSCRAALLPLRTGVLDANDS